MKKKKAPPTMLDPLNALMDDCRRNKRPAVIPSKPPKIYMDADRFRWLFTHGLKDPELTESMLAGAKERKNMEDWRFWIDCWIRDWEAKQ